DETITDQGDMLLVPAVEITIPYDEDNRTRSLPIQDGVNAGAIDASTPITTWVDGDLLDEYGISVNGPDPENGNLYVTVPVVQVEDEVGGAPVAFGARIPYIMNAAAGGWGAEHQIRLLWMVTGLIDSCEADESLNESEAEAYCSDYANWTSQRAIIQAYHDDFLIAGLTVTEDHGASAAVFGQPSSGNAYEANLWHLAEVLQDTFLLAQTVGGARFGVGDIDGHLSSWGVGAVVTSELLDLASRLELSKALNGDEMKEILNTLRPSPASGETANLLLVSESSGRSIALGAADVTVANQAIQVDLSGAGLNTMGMLRMTQYQNTTTSSCSGWCDMALADFMDELETALRKAISANNLISANLATSSDDADQIVDGAILLSRNYYLALTGMVGNFLALDGADLGTEALNDGAHHKDNNKQPVLDLVARLVSSIRQYYSLLSLSNMDIATADPAINAVGNSTWATLSEDPGAVLETLGGAENGSENSSQSAAFVEMAHYIDMWHESNAEFAESSSLIMLVEFERGEVEAVKWANRAAVGAKAAFKIWENFFAYRTLGTYGTEAAQEYLRSVEELGHLIVITGYVAELIAIGITTVMTILDNDIPVDSPAFNQVIVDAIAEVVVLTIRVALIL
ncbi:MAG: hypothetical protein KDE53_31750, partial [Caldilineaceae bacterium]|nr:hypothetical protein [Caldilineaceae bacterium]